MDHVPLAADVGLHLRVPSRDAVAEVDAGVHQFLDKLSLGRLRRAGGVCGGCVPASGLGLGGGCWFRFTLFGHGNSFFNQPVQNRRPSRRAPPWGLGFRYKRLASAGRAFKQEVVRQRAASVTALPGPSPGALVAATEERPLESPNRLQAVQRPQSARTTTDADGSWQSRDELGYNGLRMNSRREIDFYAQGAPIRCRRPRQPRDATVFDPFAGAQDLPSRSVTFFAIAA